MCYGGRGLCSKAKLLYHIFHRHHPDEVAASGLDIEHLTLQKGREKFREAFERAREKGMVDVKSGAKEDE
jgi:hypothetical protein